MANAEDLKSSDRKDLAGSIPAPGTITRIEINGYENGHRKVVSVLAHTVPPFGIHACVEHPLSFSITHIPTGARLGKDHQTFLSALRLVVYLSKDEFWLSFGEKDLDLRTGRIFDEELRVRVTAKYQNGLLNCKPGQGRKTL
jgi:hypothetical protein